MALAMHSNAPHDVMNALEISIPLQDLVPSQGPLMISCHDEEGEADLFENNRLQYTSE